MLDLTWRRHSCLQRRDSELLKSGKLHEPLRMSKICQADDLLLPQRRRVAEEDAEKTRRSSLRLPLRLGVSAVKKQNCGIPERAPARHCRVYQLRNVSGREIAESSVKTVIRV